MPILALGIIVLAVYHRGFRKVLFWTAGIGLAGFIGIGAFGILDQQYQRGAPARLHAAYASLPRCVDKPDPHIAVDKCKF